MANKNKIKSKSNTKKTKKKPAITKSRKKSKSKDKKSKFKKKYISWLLCALLILVIIVSIYHVFKPLPHNVSTLSPESRTNNLELLTDVTYQSGNKVKAKQEIFDKVNETIEEADDFIIMDMFLFNAYKMDDRSYPNIADRLTKSLVAKKKSNPNMRIIVVTDPLNTFYGSYTPPNIKELKENNIEVHYTNLRKLRDVNPIYSGGYRTFGQWFGNSENGMLRNPLSQQAPNVTVRGYLDLFNLKANHRKTLVTEKHGMVLTSNPHDSSGYHQNVGVRFTGPLQKSLIKSELAVANMSGAHYSADDFNIKENSWDDDDDYSVQLATEGKIKEQMIKHIRKLQSKDRLSIGMFYLSDRDVVNELVKASKRNVDVKLILDINKDAFGRKKNGVPNKPVASELINRSNGNIKVRWAITHGEQFHSKYLLMEQHENKDATMILGSANLTKRNIGDYNLESDIIIKGKQDSKPFKKLSNTFNDEWNNKNHKMTSQYSDYKDESLLKKVLYRIQEKTGLSSF
ncbi:phospholipase D family protein [Mammaliicoccus sp. Dog046]|uniref:phospholipase D family protein n=1 Tax=Mammaliicoccus sp. Dog046 TaxID=3034233 RepID=UPI002B262C25|nr:phospholipase D family protein [Mammaliicoccus sp. Dog046]WQK85892.1 phospholipase D family protein [Mammaliicoccus sp. Dog046]